MIPVRLAMMNFLCYGEDVEPLDFTGVQVACLSGDNGAGKSAILDAMTWALWGKARTRSDDDLVYLGRRDMEVEFEFRVDDQQYRVIRKRKRGGTGRTSQPSLELHLLTDAGYKPVTENTLRETERRIAEILRMDYDTFIHSSFLMQGRADQFTVSAPDKRKQVLGAILELDRYESMAQTAKERARQMDADVRTMRAAIDVLDRSLAQRSSAEAELREVEENLARVKDEFDTYEQLVESLRRDQGALAQYRRQGEEAQAKIRQIERELSSCESAIAQQERLITQLEKTLAEKEKIERGYSALQQGREDDRHFSGLLLTLRSLDSRQAELQMAIGVAKTKLEAEERSLAVEVEQLSQKAMALPVLEEQVESAMSNSATMEQYEQEVGVLRERERSAKLEAQAFERESVRLRGETKELQRKLGELTGDEIACPLCGGDLGEGGIERLREHYSEEIAERESTAKASAEQVQKLQAVAISARRDADALESEFRSQRSKMEKLAATLEVQIREATEASSRLPAVEQRLSEARGSLGCGAYAQTETLELRDVQAEITAIGYDPKAHGQVRSQVEALKAYEERHRQLQQAERSLEREQQALAVAIAEHDRWHAQCEEAAQQIEDVRAQIAQYPPDLDERLAKSQSALKQAQEQQQRLQQMLGAAKQRLDTLRQQAYERQEKQKKLAEMSDEKTTFEELAVAFGRSGLQAMLIENVLPELTDEANEILGRMTNNRMSVAIETQRERRSGDGLIETLDIRISDEVGTRNYELYSGGEAFRVNFALRVALSKLLARRKGAPLPTLIIDEGFGTQDSSGRERLVEAIQSVQDDFQCILVITHIDELRDAFPVRIECTKTSTGSVARVLHV